MVKTYDILKKTVLFNNHFIIEQQLLCCVDFFFVISYLRVGLKVIPRRPEKAILFFIMVSFPLDSFRHL